MIAPTPELRRASGVNELPIPLHQLTNLIARSEDAEETVDRRERLAVHAPFTGDILGHVPACTEADVKAAVERARRAQPHWARRSFSERRAILSRYHDLVLERQDGIMDLIQLESGKARRHALEEILDVAIHSRHYAFHSQRYLKPQARRGALPLLTAAWEYRHPVGVVGVIAPWNYPLSLAISDSLPALIAGNGVILKPSRQTPFTALYALQLLREAGLPPDVFQIVTGRGSVIGPALIDQVDHISFTGSTATGRHIAQQAAAQLIRYSLELGGKNPALVLDDANLHQAVTGTVRGTFSNAGQLCMAIERLYVQAGIYERFQEAFVRQVKGLEMNAALDFSADVGSLISQDQMDKVDAHVRDAVEKGATLLAGGHARPDLGPYFYEPTILTGVTPEMAVYAEETFGPVVSIYRFDRVEEGIRLANATAYGLNASVWTGNLQRGRQVARQIQAGTVNVNDAYATAWASIDAPMGGMKASGVGRRHGAEGILRYTEAQTIAARRLLSSSIDGDLPPETFASVMTWILKWMKRIPGLR